MKQHNYFVYITTNPEKNVLYTGVTNNLEQRLIEHYLCRGKRKTFAGRYFCYCLIYYERFTYVDQAIRREKEIKGWTRKKKLALIKEMNPDFRYLNEEIMEWPPDEDASLRSA